ncbi:MAG TPA: PQQ-dependent sugar dehydrogenase [Candidatus Limnocylindria bacterium]|nr:PQQ-dependent sugar dehydrogenase [Candidatus Limnocylindria bacterium]
MKSAKILFLSATAFCFAAVAATQQTQTPKASAPQTPVPSGEQVDGNFRKVVLDADQRVNGEWQDTVKDPMELAVAADGQVFYAERAGVIKMWKPDTKTAVTIAQIKVFDGLEDGMIGITLDPKFLQNHWVYLNHSLPEMTKDANGKKTGIIRVSRYTLVGDKLDLTTEKALIDIPTQREECCHVGGSLGFDKDGNLYIAIGDNTNPFDSDGYSPHDGRPGRSPWDSQKSSANMNNLRGGISRIHPEADGTYTIPKGNLFPPGTPGTRPEVYVKGTRNGYRLSIDQRNGILYWGDVGPDAGGFDPKRGPGGFDEVMQAKKPGFFGWPYSRGDNKPYARIDFDTRAQYVKEKAAYDKEKSAYDKVKTAHVKAVKEAKEKGEPEPASLPPFALKPPASYIAGQPIFFDPAHPVNTSPNNTGVKELPPTQPAFIWYPGGASARFPVVNAGGGRTAMAGPVYYFDPNNKSKVKLPKEYDHTLFIYEWSRNWIIAVHLDENDNIAKNADGSLKMERIAKDMTFKRPMDMELGPDGCLYLIEFGTAWGNNKDTQIVRLEYTGPQN